MRTRILALPVLLFAPLAVFAQEAETSVGAAFADYAQGWTLYFERDGEPFGVESFDEDGDVVWKPEGGACERGVWGHDGDRVCFLYPGVASCWRMARDAEGFVAEAEDDPGLRLRIARRDRRPVLCAEGPEL